MYGDADMYGDDMGLDFSGSKVIFLDVDGVLNSYEL